MTLEIKHSESLYYINGDIVLLSLPKDNVITAFKVDRVFLLRACPVFERMFTLPPSGDVESYDNVPLVRMQDEAEHLTMFLKALYDPSFIPWKKHDINTVRIVEGILLLATKYEADYLRERIVSLLERDWPPELSYWDINETEIAAKEGSGEFEDEELVPDPCEVIRLARKCNIPSILPAAFYHLSRIRGTLDHHLSDSLRKIFPNKRSRTAQFSLLSAQDLRRLIVGRDAMFVIFQGYLAEAHKDVGVLKHVTSKDSTCRGPFYKLKDELRLEILQYYSDPLSVMKREVAEGLTDPPCAQCREEFFYSLNNNRDIFWDQLPSLFMLDTDE